MKNSLSALQQRWAAFSPREQKLLLGGVSLCVVAIIYWGVLAPLNQKAELAQARIISERQLLNWVTDKADAIIQLRAQGGVVATAQPLNQVISSSVQRFQIELIRIQPRDEMMQVWIQPLPFSKLVDWLAFLKEQQGVDVEFMDINRAQQSGVVEVKRLQLKRGGE
ncbi:type II secretion system protein M [Vibrio ordalii]|uniref:type II secretion system protein M n=1 Tax=Vibrio ordalii TaxID=28174 RepID=UPI000248344C|nr:type II secretion system protein M [Vibrio ordalii]